MIFSVEWLIGRAEWTQAKEIGERWSRGSDYDRHLLAMQELLPGVVRFRRGGEPLELTAVEKDEWPRYYGIPMRSSFESSDPADTELVQGWGVWITDFANALAYFFGADQSVRPSLGDSRIEVAQDGEFFVFNDALSPLQIVFRKASGSIEIASPEKASRGWRALVPEEEFYAGCRRFLREIAAALEENAPGLLTWESFEPLLALA